MKNKRKPADTLTLFQKNTPIQPNTGLSTVASAPRANVHDFWSLVNEPLKEGGRRGKKRKGTNERDKGIKKRKDTCITNFFFVTRLKKPCVAGGKMP